MTDHRETTEDVLDSIRRLLTPPEGSVASDGGTSRDTLVLTADRRLPEDGPVVVLHPRPMRLPPPLPREAAAPDVVSDAMRALIVRAVEEELAGALGARITRNVRKTVRQEIRAILADSDLD